MAVQFLGTLATNGLTALINIHIAYLSVSLFNLTDRNIVRQYIGNPSEQMEMAEERRERERERGDVNAHLQHRTSTALQCTMKEAGHILAVLRHSHKRPSQLPTLPCARTSYMQSIVRPRKITRNQPSAPTAHEPPEWTTAESRRPLWAKEMRREGGDEFRSLREKQSVELHF